jgi:hypothetical protein
VRGSAERTNAKSVRVFCLRLGKLGVAETSINAVTRASLYLLPAPHIITYKSNPLPRPGCQVWKTQRPTTRSDKPAMRIPALPVAVGSAASPCQIAANSSATKMSKQLGLANTRIKQTMSGSSTWRCAVRKYPKRSKRNGQAASKRPPMEHHKLSLPSDLLSRTIGRALQNSGRRSPSLRDRLPSLGAKRQTRTNFDKACEMEKPHIKPVP